MIIVFLILLLGHLVADFLLQSDAMMRRKRGGSAWGYAQHGLAHALCTLLLAAVFATGLLWSIGFYALVAALCAVHLLIDYAKLALTRNEVIGDGLRAFLADQALHVFTIAAAAMIYTRPHLAALGGIFSGLQAQREKILAVLIVYASIGVGGGYAIRYLLRPLLRRLPPLPDETAEELRNAGLYIGWLERILILTAVLLRSPATVGLVLTAKSIVRYPEIKSGRFAEYFLIGTLLSILLALLGGIILLKILYGRVGFVS
ncbi:MAG TPA: DUF3307 domain-containing protein [Verrucomicrobiae bacterium]|nr:DUF3307 domain-containing protein [Verrucomicrobiae bacterium]